MRTRLRQLWQGRAPRERAVIAVLAALLGVVLYLWLLQSVGRSRDHLVASVATLRSAAASLELQALELERLRAAPGLPVSRSDLVAQVQAQADAAGLGHALTRIEVRDPNQVAVTFGAVAFADWLGWVASLGAQQTRLSACRIEALAEPGMVGVTATLQRAQ
jgi:type II secretory pathway component PulM